MKKNIKILSLIILGLLMFVGCTTSQSTPSNKYDIIYYLNDEKIVLEPNTYTKGEGVTLAIPSIEDDEIFSGWYDNPYFDGNIISSISKTDEGDKTYYGKIETKKVDPIIYNIEYYLNGEKINLMPNTYEKGSKVVLPTPGITGVETFSGWYDNNSLTGTEYTTISENETGNKVFYGQTYNLNNPTLETLKTAFTKNNYSYTFKEMYDDVEYIESYQNDNGVYANTYEDIYGDSCTDYYLLEDGFGKVVYNSEGTWYYTLEGDYNFDYFAGYMILASFDNLVAEHFEYNTIEKAFVLKDEYLQDDVTNFMGAYEGEIFASCMIYLEDDLVNVIEVTSLYEVEGYTYLTTYEFIYSNYNTTTVTVPTAIYDMGESDYDVVDIVDVYSRQIDETVTISGEITGIYGNNFYLNDTTSGILVYLGSDSTYVSLIEEGSSYLVTGTIEEYKGVYQLSDIMAITYLDTDFEVDSKTLNSLSQIALKNEIAEVVKVENATIESLPSSYTTSSDTSFKISLNGDIVDVFMSRHVASNIQNQVFDILKNLQIGDTINIDSLHVGKYNDYQLVITSTTVLNVFTGPIEEVGLVIQPVTLSVEQGITLDEIMGKISVYVKYNNNATTLLTADKYQVTNNFVEDIIGKYEITFTYGTYQEICEVTVYEKGAAYVKPTIDEAPLYSVLDQMGYDAETGITYGISKGLPSTGEPKVLVIPVEFTDALAPSTMVEDLETTFFGTSEETGWESLQSYYYKSSYGKLNITGTVLEPFNTGKASTSYTSEEFDYEIIKAALEYYDTQIDYSEYDTDKDGYIDSLYIIYTRDYDDSGDSNWWAYTYEYYTEDYEYYDDVEADYYVFMSYQFIFDKLQGKTVKYNAETVIHETGHLLGLNDYYDYDENAGPAGGIGGGDMMDYNVGDHNAYSKLMLGWITPYVLTGQDITLDLQSFAATGECIMICKNWNGSFFDEYYIIDFYTPTGLNEMGKGESGLFSVNGIRIYHIDATLKDPSECFSVWEVTKYDNSYTEHRLIRLVEADGNSDIDDWGWSGDSDLFQVGNIYSDAYWYDNTKAGFTLIVNSITDTSASITITF